MVHYVGWPLSRSAVVIIIIILGLPDDSRNSSVPFLTHAL